MSYRLSESTYAPSTAIPLRTPPKAVAPRSEATPSPASTPSPSPSRGWGEYWQMAKTGGSILGGLAMEYWLPLVTGLTSIALFVGWRRGKSMRMQEAGFEALRQKASVEAQQLAHTLKSDPQQVLTRCNELLNKPTQQDLHWETVLQTLLLRSKLEAAPEWQAQHLQLLELLHRKLPRPSLLARLQEGHIDTVLKAAAMAVDKSSDQELRHQTLRWAEVLNTSIIPLQNMRIQGRLNEADLRTPFLDALRTAGKERVKHPAFSDYLHQAPSTLGFLKEALPEAEANALISEFQALA